MRNRFWRGWHNPMGITDMNAIEQKIEKLDKAWSKTRATFPIYCLTDMGIDLLGNKGSIHLAKDPLPKLFIAPFLSDQDQAVAEYARGFVRQLHQTIEATRHIYDKLNHEVDANTPEAGKRALEKMKKIWNCVSRTCGHMYEYLAVQDQDLFWNYRAKLRDNVAAYETWETSCRMLDVLSRGKRNHLGDVENIKRFKEREKIYYDCLASLSITWGLFCKY